jgi:predicted MPP superfamily phosphohydrolase
MMIVVVVGHHAGNLVFALSAVVDAVVVIAAVAWALRGGRSAWRLLFALVVVAVLLAVKGVVLVLAGVEVGFGVMHVLWLDLVVVAPIAGIALLIFGHRSGRAVRALGCSALLLAPVGAYASFVEPERIVVERADVQLPPEREGHFPVKIGLIADLQFERLGGHERKAVERLLAERPDLILLAGDYHQGSVRSFTRELPELQALLSRLDAPAGVFAVEGDAESQRKARRIFAGTGIRLLVNEVASVRVRGRRLTIGGVELAHRSHSARKLARRLETDRSDSDVRVLLAHRPDVLLGLGHNTRIDLVAAGHTHGGQLQLPLLGPLHTASRLPRRVGAGGLHTLRGNRIYISRGVGVERAQAPKLRLGAPPEVSLITLR